MSRVARKAAADGAMDEENEENIPPQSRRSERVKGRKSASKKDLGRSVIIALLTWNRGC